MLNKVDNIDAADQGTFCLKKRLATIANQLGN